VIIEHERTNANEFVRIVDAETGEVIDQFWRERRSKPSGRPPGGRKPHFMKVYAANWRQIVKEKRLTPVETGVLFMCLAFVGWESNFLVHPKTRKNLGCSELADLIGYSRQGLQPILESLTRKGLIATVKTGDGRANNYILNSHVVFWGNRIGDLSEHEVFNSEACGYVPAVRVMYRERNELGVISDGQAEG